MKVYTGKIKWAFGFIFFTFFNINAQKNFTLEEIWSGRFRTEYLYNYQMVGDHEMIKGDFENGKYEINLYDVPSWKKKETIFSTAKYPEFRYVMDFSFSKDLNYWLLSPDVQYIYRHSFKGKYYLFDRRQGKLTLLTEDYIQIPSFHPDGKKVVFFRENNLYYKDFSSGEIKAITTDGRKNQIINGKTDWVYEEEFGFVKAYAISKNGQYLAYLKFDESQVPEFTMLLYDNRLYPEAYTYKYPKAGQPNSSVSLHIYDFETGKSKQIDLGTYEYLPYLEQGYLPDEFLVMSLNRHQNDLKLFSVRADGSYQIIGRQKSDKYVDFERVNNIKWLDKDRYFWLSERDGYNHIYLFDLNGKILRQITNGNWEVTDFYGYDPVKQRLYYQSTENGSINRVIYSVNLKGKNKKRLSPASGYASAGFTNDFRYFILNYSNSDTPPQYIIYETPGKKKTPRRIKTIISNEKLLSVLGSYNLIQKEFISFSSADGAYMLNAYVYKPLDFDPSKKYPVLIYQYNGPGVQTVLNAWGRYNDYYHQMLAQNGIIVISVDTRGTGGRGAGFRQLTYKQLGKLELEDLKAVVKELSEWRYVDKEKIGIWGWSYGGFMASNAILQASDLFAMAIAVAPVTNWRFYDTVYTERYMQTPDENPGGYDDNSPLTYADYLNKPFMIIHGTADDNVHVQNTYRLAEKFQEVGKNFDMHIYPDKNHGIYGGQTRYQLYKKMYDFIINNLKK